MKNIIFLALFFQGCAYFNTFYNAKRYYNDGIQRKKSGSSGIEFFRKSAEKCEKVLSWFPTSRWADDALYLLALNYYELEELEKAKIKFKEFKSRFPNSPFLPYVYLYLGKIYLIEDQLEEAEEYLTYAKRFKIWDISKEITKEELKIYLKRNETMKVIESGENALSKFPEKKYEILKIVSDAYLNINDTSRALHYLKEIYKEVKIDSIGMKIAKIYMSIDSFNKANEILRNYSSPEAKIMRGSCLFKIGFIDSAIIEVENLFLTRRDKFALLSSVLLSDIYEKIGDTAKSYEILKKASQFNISDTLLFYVKRKVNYLSFFYEDNGDTNISEELLLQSFFHLAEAYLLYKGDHKTAFEMYKMISEKYNDTIYVPKSLFAVGFIHLNNNRDTMSAISTFKEIKNRFKETVYSKAADEILGKIEGNIKK